MKSAKDTQFSKSDRPVNPSRFNRYLRLGVFLSVIVLIMFAIGFAGFLGQVESFKVLDKSNFKADGIVVLTGGYARLEPAVELLKQNRGERLLISGVNRTTSDKLLKDVLGIEDTLYDCCVDVDQDALNTIGNAVGAADWISSKNYTDIIVVTNDYHMPRSLIEFGRRLKDVRVYPYAVSNAYDHTEKVSTKIYRYRVLLGEYVKYLVARIRGIAQMNGATKGIVSANLSTGW
ncbi:MAG: YdcF family protein [Ahrensia sp.]|nr:YdcF family protein [Ahrensia sp.]